MVVLVQEDQVNLKLKLTVVLCVIKYHCSEKRLAEIDKQSFTQRKERGSLYDVALVGYTNVGKSTIMNLLSKRDVFAENKLFATLDTTTSKVVFENTPFLLSDTVGFIREITPPFG